MNGAGLWDRWNESGTPSYPHAKVIQFCLRHYPPPERPRTRVLDVGCGSGVNTRFLAEQGFACAAVDLSPVGVANTRRLLAAHGLGAGCCVARIEALPFADASLDLAICIGVLDSAGAEAARAGVAEIARILRAGGRALLVFASEADMRAGAGTSYGLHGYTPGQVLQLTRGFSGVDIDRYITTYGGGTSQHNDFLVTLTR